MSCTLDLLNDHIGVCLISAVVSSGAGGAMAPPLLERFTKQFLVKIAPLKMQPFSDGTTTFENLTTAMPYEILVTNKKLKKIKNKMFSNYVFA